MSSMRKLETSKQDNASIHVSKETKKWLNDQKIALLDWPACSPDLNIMENLWGILVRRIYHSNRQFGNVEELEAAIMEAWQQISLEDIQKLVDSIPNRIFQLVCLVYCSHLMHYSSGSTYYLLQLLTIACLLTFGLIQMVQAQLNTVEVTEEMEFANVTFSKTMVFTENTSLIEDINLLEHIFENQKKINLSTTPIPQNGTKSKSEAPLELNLLLVADHSLYEAFVELQHGDEFAAYHSLNLYLNGIFEQLRTIFNRWNFFGTQKVKLRLAGTIPILRPEDCPLRGPLVKQRYQDYLYYTNNSNSSMTTTLSMSSDYFDGPPIANTTANATNDQEQPHDPFNRTMLNRHHSWKSIDGLEAVHLIHEWAEKHTFLMPAYEHMVVFTRLDLLSQANDSATQGMAYVGAMCMGTDSASVVEDVGGLSSAAIAAHEMVHSLGAFHDGWTGNCSGKDNFLMAPTSSGSEFGKTFDNAFLLSECSTKEVEEYLRGGTSTTPLCQ
uniref:Peptidase M12B domain-containing protein n=1 Tax=Ditylenchus dipsaci TaxID=166011 RepID=A0A915EHQ0_9BILA